MFCPSCGKQQVNNDVRFCFSCGFQLGGVTDLLNNKGMLLNPQQPVLLPNSPRKKGMKNGAKLMFLSAVFTPIAIGLCALADHPGPLIIPFTIFLAGLCWLVYSAIFGEEYVIPQASKFPQQFGANPPQQFMQGPPRSALPSADNYRVNMSPQRVNTSEIVDSPTSVTEHTTHLLEKE
jgi:hypothetical protein